MGPGQDDGLSDALGAIILVAVVGLGVAILGVSIMSQQNTEKIPALSVDITTIGRAIYITHYGGDPLQKDAMAIIVDGTDKKDSFETLDKAPWSAWAVGDTLVYNVPGDEPMPEGVTIFYIGGSSPRIIQSMGVPQSVSAGGVYPTGPTGTITPVTTATTAVPTAPVSADFTASPTTGIAPLSVQFLDASTGPVTSWSWNFGDSGTSGDRNPVHQYLSAGTYPVSLTVGNGTGTSTMTKTDYITVNQYAPGLLANYFNDQSWSVPAITKIATRIRYADSESGYDSDLTNWPMDYIGKTDDFSVSFDGYLLVATEDDYTFYLTSDDGSYLYIDGSLVVDNGGLHSPRTYSATVHLTAGYHPIQVKMFENTGQAVAYLEYSTPSVVQTFVTDLYHIPETAPFSDFTATPRVGTAPLVVQFTDTSVDAGSWSWDFGDGSEISHMQDPQHTYSSGGSYDVSLTTSNSFGSNTVSKEDYIVLGSLDPGLLASYYYGQTWTDLAGTRTDARIRFADPAGVSSGYASDEDGWPSSMVGRQEDFSVSWDGYLNVPSGDTYTFYLTSDDGSWLWIDDVMVVDNGGLHSPQTISGTTTLSSGYHALRVRMYENTGNAVAHLEYSTPAVARTFVTDLWQVPAGP